MEKIDLYRVYEFGKTLRPLANLYGDTNSFEVYLAIIPAKRAMDVLLDNHVPHRITLSRNAALEVQKAIDGIRREYFADKKAIPSPGDDKIPGWRLDTVVRTLQNFEAVFRAEFQEAPTYSVPKRGIYATADLVDRGADTFPISLHDAIGVKALTEYAAGARCFAFGLTTATGFHVCRAVESVLEAYYQDVTGTDRTCHGWNDYIVELERHAKGESAPAKFKPEMRTLGTLKQMKDSDRNPLMHPRLVLTENDADMLLNAGKVVIMQMATERAKARSAPLASTRTGAEILLGP